MDENLKYVVNPLPRHGYINELAKLCNCDRKTVRRALYYGHNGPKSRFVKEQFKKLYVKSCAK